MMKLKLWYMKLILWTKNTISIQAYHSKQTSTHIIHQKEGKLEEKIWAQLFKTNDVVS